MWFFFFFKQKTAYEMRISDWSSDVCSSDLANGVAWARQPTLLPCLGLGLLTVLFPYFVMQPALGAGIAGSKTPNPAQARIRSLATHAVFGVGLYLAAVMAAAILP